MTNREWLNSLTDQEFAEWCVIDHYGLVKEVECTTESGEKCTLLLPEHQSLNDIARSSTSSLEGIRDWLAKEKR